MEIDNQVFSQARLENKSQGHNKFYELTIRQDIGSGKWGIYARYGKIGTLGTTIQKHSGPGYPSLSIAQMTMSELVNEKVAKGYVLTKRFDRMGKQEQKKKEPKSRFGNIINKIKEK